MTTTSDELQSSPLSPASGWYPQPGFDFTDPDVLRRGIPATKFAELRKSAPVWWDAQDESIFGDGGYWVISRHADIKAISRDGALWSTNRKGAVMRLPDGVTAAVPPTTSSPGLCKPARTGRPGWIKLIFNEIADEIPDIRKLSEPQRLRSGWINGVKDLQVAYG